jgi:hypothetical protein
VKPETHITTVSSRHWGPGDDYEVVEVQVFDLPARTPVRITVEPLSQEEYNSYCEGKTDAAGNEIKQKAKSRKKR